MWNGFWKLTVMVGVVGIGLFAVYQAQKGMNRFASSAASDLPGDETADNSDPSDNTSNEEPLLLSVDPSADGPGTRSRRKRPNDDRIDLVRNLDTEPASIKQAVGNTNSSPHKIALASQSSRQKGLSFQEPDEAFDESEKNQTIAIPQALPDNDFMDETTELRTTPTTRESDEPSEEVGEPQTDSDPFDDQTAPPAGDQQPPESTSSSQQNLPDFGDDSDIPRSRRGMENSARQKAPSIEEDPNTFDSESNPNKAPFEEDTLKELPSPDASEVPETNNDLPESNDFSQDRSPEVKSRSLPADIPNIDDAAPLRSRPPIHRPKLPVDLDDEFTRQPADRGMEPVKRKPAVSPAMPADMIGDGVAGDSSQRGLQQPKLTIEKVAQHQAVVDQPLVYTILVRNQGNVAAHNVVIEDRIPKGTELLGTSPRAELVGKTLIWKEQVLRPNEEKKISIKVVPKQEGPIGSVARVHFATEVSAEIQVAAPPQLEFTVEAPREVRIGQTVDLVFQLKNIGKVEANNISVRDLVPDHLKHETGHDIECPIGKLAPNEVREIVLPVSATRVGTGLNRAILTADGGIQKQLDTSIEVVSDNLVLTRSGHNRVYVERPAVFTNTIRNEGRIPAEKVRVSEIVPTGMEFETASDGGKYYPGQNAVVWTIGGLAPGDDRVLTVKYVPKETGTHSSRITAAGASGSQAEIQSKVEVVGRPEIQMETLSATGVVTVGDKITSKFTLRNSGTAPARNVKLQIQLPAELRVLSARGAKFQKDKNTIVFDTIEEMLPRTSSTFELAFEPVDEADARIVVEIIADHLSRPHRREESIQIVRDSLK